MRWVLERHAPFHATLASAVDCGALGLDGSYIVFVQSSGLYAGLNSRRQRT